VLFLEARLKKIPYFAKALLAGVSIDCALADRTCNRQHKYVTGEVDDSYLLFYVDHALYTIRE